MPKRGIIGPAIVILVAILSIAGLIVLGISIGKKSVGSTTTNPVVTTQSSSVPSPSVDETANWKTYTNTKYSYSIKYPPDWGISTIWQTDTASKLNEAQVIGIVKNGTGGQPGYTVRIYGPVQNPSNLSLDDWIKSDSNKNGTILAIVPQKPTPTSVNGYKGYKLTNQIGQITLVEHNKTIYEIYFPLANQSSNSLQTTFDQILSTFKFTQ